MHELFERDEIHVDAGGLHRGEVELLAGTLAAALELVEHAADRHDNELARVGLLGILDDAGSGADVVGLGQDVGLALRMRQHERVGVGLRRVDDLLDGDDVMARAVAVVEYDVLLRHLLGYEAARFWSGMNKICCCGSSDTILTALELVTHTSLQLLISTVELT